MIPNDQPLRYETIDRMLKFINDTEDKELSQWEEDFIESITTQFEERRNLSNKQCEILERIYDKI